MVRQKATVPRDFPMLAAGDGLGVLIPPEEDDILYEEDEEEEDEMDSLPMENENDAEFLQELDKMVAEGGQERKAIRPSQDIAVPIKPNKTQSDDSQNSFCSMLVRKGNKTLVKGFNVPKDSELVKSLMRSEQAVRQEREDVKKLTLDIQRMQLEDSQDSNSTDSNQPSANTNHQRRVRYSTMKSSYQ